MPARGCGASRTAGGVYLVTKVGPNGIPFEDCILDPPIAVPEDFNLTALGVRMFERNGVWHIADLVGMDSYPNVADVLEEDRRFGSSRKISPNLPLHLLTRESRHLKAHTRAIITNYREYGEWTCVKRMRQHDPDYIATYDSDTCHMNGLPYEAPVTCGGAWYEDIDGGETHAVHLPRLIRRPMPGGFYYNGRSRPEGVTPIYQPAFFLALPITCLEVVQGEGASQRAEKIRATAQLPVDLVEE